MDLELVCVERLDWSGGLLCQPLTTSWSQSRPQNGAVRNYASVKEECSSFLCNWVRFHFLYQVNQTV